MNEHMDVNEHDAGMNMDELLSMYLDEELDEKTLAYVQEQLEDDPEWQEAMIEYQDHLENLKRAVENKQLEVVHHEIRDLRARMKSCHRDFK